MSAMHRASQENVALKVLDKTALSEVDLKQARKEAEILRSLKHPNVLKCYDFFESENRIVLVLKRMKSTLIDYLMKLNYRLGED